MRLIDADYILSALGVFTSEEPESAHFMNGIKTAREIVVDAPTMVVLEPRHAVEPAKLQVGNRTDYFCRDCTTEVGMLFLNEDVWRFHYRFCPQCGREVKWDD